MVEEFLSANKNWKQISFDPISTTIMPAAPARLVWGARAPAFPFAFAMVAARLLNMKDTIPVAFGRFDLDAMDAETARILFRYSSGPAGSGAHAVKHFERLIDDSARHRFQQDDIPLLAANLRLPERVRLSNRMYVPCVEALCVALWRLAYPNRLTQGVAIFYRDVSTISRIFFAVVTHIVETFGQNLKVRGCARAWAAI